MEAEIAAQKRKERLSILKKMWKEKRETAKYEEMLKKLRVWKLDVVDKEIEDIEMLLDAMILIDDYDWCFDELEMALDTEQDVEMRNLDRLSSTMETSMMEVGEVLMDQAMQMEDSRREDHEMESEEHQADLGGSTLSWWCV